MTNRLALRHSLENSVKSGGYNAHQQGRLGYDLEQSQHHASELDERESGTARLDEAVTAYDTAPAVFIEAGARHYIIRNFFGAWAIVSCKTWCANHRDRLQWHNLNESVSSPGSPPSLCSRAGIVCDKWSSICRFEVFQHSAKFLADDFIATAASRQ